MAQTVSLRSLTACMWVKSEVNACIRRVCVGNRSTWDGFICEHFGFPFPYHSIISL